MNINSSYNNYNMSMRSVGSARSAVGLYSGGYRPGNVGYRPESTWGSSSNSQGFIQSVTDLKTGASDLKKVLKDLANPLYHKQKTPVSSDTDAMTVKYTAGKDKVKEIALEVKIDQIATGQTNAGTAVQAGAYKGSTGTQNFTIEVGGKKHDIQVEVKAGETNEAVQKKMAEAINKKDLGITATVATDAKGKTSTLSIASVKTGDDSVAFKIQDSKGSLSANMGIKEPTTQAQNAIYSVGGGGQKTSASNQVDLGNGITATLKKPTTEAVKVEMGVDRQGAIDRVKDMAASYNKLYGVALENSGSASSSKLFDRLVNTSKVYASTMAKIGITFSGKGEMVVDDKKIEEASKNGKLDAFFTENRNTSFGFTNQLSQIAGDVSRNTARYVDRSSLGLATSSGDFLSNYMSSLQGAGSNNPMGSMGLLFDMFW